METRWLGRIGYQEALELQHTLREAVQAGAPDVCLLLEHDPVVTLGRRGGLVDAPALEALATPVIATDRGGYATWHGPGQLVAYPIMDTQRARYGIKPLVARLGDIMIAIAEAFGLQGVVFDPERPGVYVRERKLGSIGLHLTRGITTHGFAINICNNLDGFRAIVPCGFADLQITTVAIETVSTPSIDEARAVAERLIPEMLTRRDKEAATAPAVE
jgi:lipoyl(octanoyl) transferase